MLLALAGALFEAATSILSAALPLLLKSFATALALLGCSLAFRGSRSLCARRALIRARPSLPLFPLATFLLRPTTCLFPLPPFELTSLSRLARATFFGSPSLLAPSFVLSSPVSLELALPLLTFTLACFLAAALFVFRPSPTLFSTPIALVRSPAQLFSRAALLLVPAPPNLFSPSTIRFVALPRFLAQPPLCLASALFPPPLALLELPSASLSLAPLAFQFPPACLFDATAHILRATPTVLYAPAALVVEAPQLLAPALLLAPQLLALLLDPTPLPPDSTPLPLDPPICAKREPAREPRGDEAHLDSTPGSPEARSAQPADIVEAEELVLEEEVVRVVTDPEDTEIVIELQGDLIHVADAGTPGHSLRRDARRTQREASESE